MSNATNPTPVCLLILDGFGYREETANNAIAQARKPNIDALWNQFPHTLINASEHYVGLPDGQMGNSEVGHLNIGAGRVVFQDFERINNSIKTGEFFEIPSLKAALLNLNKNNKALHIFGLLSDGGVHSHHLHIHAMLEMAAKLGLTKIYVHAFLDGRDTPPISAAPYIAALEAKIKELGVGKIISVSGRFYSMDRDKRWPRVEAAYALITEGLGEFTYATANEALQAAYARGENDEFVKCTAIRQPNETATHLEDGDLVVYMNFRSDRARQLTHALLSEEFDGFHRRHVPKLAGYFTLTMHDAKETKATDIFPPFAVKNTFGEYLSNLEMCIRDRLLADQGQVPLDYSCCIRTKFTPPQASLPLKARTKNIKGAFAVTSDLTGKRVVLVDDVMTTGASLNELAKMLKKAGAAHVECWVVARTLPHN